MFGFPTDFFGLHNAGNRRANTSNALVPHHQGLFGNAMMLPMPFMSSPFGGGGSNPFDTFGLNASPFAMMDRMMRSANDSLLLGGNTSSSAPMHSFTSTTVMSYSGTDGRPKVYQESTSRSRGPGGLEETRQAIRDSERGINKVTDAWRLRVTRRHWKSLGSNRSSHRRSKTCHRTWNERGDGSDIRKCGIGKSRRRRNWSIQERMARTFRTHCRPASPFTPSLSSSARFHTDLSTSSRSTLSDRTSLCDGLVVQSITTEIHEELECRVATSTAASFRYHRSNGRRAQWRRCERNRTVPFISRLVDETKSLVVLVEWLEQPTQTSSTLIGKDWATLFFLNCTAPGCGLLFYCRVFVSTVVMTLAETSSSSHWFLSYAGVSSFRCSQPDRRWALQRYSNRKRASNRIPISLSLSLMSLFILSFCL